MTSLNANANSLPKIPPPNANALWELVHEFNERNTEVHSFWPLMSLQPGLSVQSCWPELPRSDTPYHLGHDHSQGSYQQ